MTIHLEQATIKHLSPLLSLIKAYHAFEGINMTDSYRKRAVSSLLMSPLLGRIWLIQVDCQPVGYIVLTFGYSIEFGGQDAFVDEFYIIPKFRGQGLGLQALSIIQQKARSENMRALHLEVSHDNQRAQRLYTRANFESRDKYMLMSIHLDQ